MNWWVWLAIGVFVGVCFGYFIACLMVAASRGEREYDHEIYYGFKPLSQKDIDEGIVR